MLNLKDTSTSKNYETSIISKTVQAFIIFKHFYSTFISWIQKNNNINILIIILYTGIAYFFGYWNDSSQSLIAHDEGLYAGRARLILDLNDWFTPFDSAHHKTVGSYWLIALSTKYLGISEFSARFPSGIFSIGCSIIMYYISRLFVSQPFSLLASILLPCMPLWMQYSRYASPDIPYIFFILLFYFSIIKSTSISRNYPNIYFYSFISGLFLSIAFFLRSVMAFLPLLALLPHIYKNRSRINKLQLFYFFLGILIGISPFALSLIFSLNKYGFDSISTLLGFAKDKVVGFRLYKTLFFYPTSILCLAFPLSLISIKPVSFSDINKLKYILLSPLFIFISLTFVSTKYAHYALILYPFISLYSVIILESIYKHITLYSPVKYSFIFTFVGAIILFLSLEEFFNFTNFFNASNSIQIINVFIPLAILYLLVGVLLFLKNISNKKFVYLFTFLSFVQTVTLSFAYSFGHMGNPNKEIKSFVTDPFVSSIINNNSIYIVNMNGKTKTLMQYYLPKSKHFKGQIKSLPNKSFAIVHKRNVNLEISNNYNKFIVLSNYKSWLLVKINGSRN